MHHKKSYEERYIHRWSVGALLLGPIHHWATGLVLRGLLFFIPLVNIYIWIEGILYARRLSWERRDWKSFNAFRNRQRLLDIFAAALALAVTVMVLYRVSDI